MAILSALQSALQSVRNKAVGAEHTVGNIASSTFHSLQDDYHKFSNDFDNRVSASVQRLNQGAQRVKSSSLSDYFLPTAKIQGTKGNTFTPINVFSTVPRTIGEQRIPIAFGSGIKGPKVSTVANLAKDIVQSSNRLGASGMLTLQGEKQYTPTSKIAKIIVGDQPVTSFTEKARKTSEFLQQPSFSVGGVNIGKPQLSPGTSKLAAVPIVALGALSDYLPLGWGKKEGAVEAVKLAKAAKTVEEFASLINKSKTASKEIAALIKNTKSPVNSMEDFFNVVKEAGKETANIANLPKRALKTMYVTPEGTTVKVKNQPKTTLGMGKIVSQINEALNPAKRVANKPLELPPGATKFLTGQTTDAPIVVKTVDKALRILKKEPTQLIEVKTPEQARAILAKVPDVRIRISTTKLPSRKIITTPPAIEAKRLAGPITDEQLALNQLDTTPAAIESRVPTNEELAMRQLQNQPGQEVGRIPTNEELAMQQLNQVPATIRPPVSAEDEILLRAQAARDADALRTQVPSSISDIAYQQAKANGGITISLKGDQPVTGYVYSPSKLTEEQVPVAEFTLAHVDDFKAKHFEELLKPGNHLGIWEDNGIMYMDVSRVGERSQATLDAAEKSKQLAVYDIDTGETIYTKLGKSENEKANISNINGGENLRTDITGVPPGSGEVPSVASAGGASEVPGAPGQPTTPGIIAPLTSPEDLGDFNGGALRNLSTDAKTLLKKFDADEKIAKVEANYTALNDATGLDPKTEWSLVKYAENPTPETAARLGLDAETIANNQDILIKHRAFDNAIFNAAGKAGYDIRYLKDHVLHQWIESPAQIKEIITNTTPEEIEKLAKSRGIKLTPGFVRERKIDSYELGEALGLHPKFTTFGQLHASAQHELGRSIAGKELINGLIKDKSVLPMSAKSIPAGWKAIDVGGKAYWAEQNTANVIHNIFGAPGEDIVSKGLRATAAVGRHATDVTLSGGIGPANWFGLGMLLKEISAGRVVKPLRGFFRTYAPGATKANQAENFQALRELASYNVELGTVLDYKRIFKNVTTDKSITQVLGRGWHKFINEPTFNKFIPDIQLDFYKDTKNTLIKKGYAEQEAVRLAAVATQKFYGMTNSLGRSKNAENLLATVFLAPKYREQMVSIFTNIAKAFKPGNIGKPEYKALRMLSVGLALHYALYNVAQISLTGKPMWDNPPGKEFELVVPVGDPKDGNFISIPYMTSFFTVPRAAAGAASALVQGDRQQLESQVAKFFSIPLSKGLEILSNKDYFGNPIYGEGKKAGDVAYYLSKSFAPGYIRGITDVAIGKTTPAMGLVQALEIPLRKGRYPNPYYTAKDELDKGLTTEEKKITDYLTTPDSKGGPGYQEEAALLIANPSAFDYYKKLKLATDPNDPLWSRPDEDIRAYIAYQATDDTQTKAQIRLANPWIPSMQMARTEKFQTDFQDRTNPTPGYDQNSVQGQLQNIFIGPQKVQPNQTQFTPRPPDPIQLLSEDQVKVASAYTAAPKGSLIRQQLLAKNPWLKQYWDARSAYYDAYPIEDNSPLSKYLKSIGIEPSSGGGGGGFSYGNKTSKLKVSKSKTKSSKIKFSQAKSIRPLKSLKIKSPTTTASSRGVKVKTYKMPKIRLTFNRPKIARLSQLGRA